MRVTVYVGRSFEVDVSDTSEGWEERVALHLLKERERQPPVTGGDEASVIHLDEAGNCHRSHFFVSSPIPSNLVIRRIEDD